MRKVLARLPFYLLPGLADILWISAFIGVIGLGPRMMNIDGDLGRHLTIGGYILDHGRVPTADLFSHTMLGQPLTPHEWLAQVLLAGANRLLGLNGVVLLCGLVIATSFWLVYRQSRERSQSLLPAVLVTVLAIAASSLHWLTRPHVFTFLMLALWLQVLEDLRRGHLHRWWLLPLLMLAWANLHGAFIAGFVTWMLYGVGLGWDVVFHRLPKGEALHGHFWRVYFLGGAVSLLVTLLNPAGIGLWATSTGFISNAYLVGHTAEYLPPNFQDPSTRPFLLMIALLAALFGLQGKRLEGARVIPAVVWLVMGLYSVRNVPLFAIVSAPLLAGALGDWLEENHHLVKPVRLLHALDQRLLHTDLCVRGVFWPALVVLLVLLGWHGGAALDFQQRGNQFAPQIFPVQAVDWLADHPQNGNIFNYFPWGGYLLYRAWPEQRVFIDGQTDFYGEHLTRQYEQVLTLSPGWEAVLSQYKIRWMLLPPNERISEALRSQPGWRSVYQDDTAEVFVKVSD